MAQLAKKIPKKFVIIAAIILSVVILYLVFFRPNPIVRVNWNKIIAQDGVSALSIEAPEEVGSVGKIFTVTIKLDTQGSLVNAVESIIDFDPKVLEVVTTNTEESFCKFYPENTFDNSNGEVRLSCGAPYPGFRGTNSIETIQFLTKAIKSTDIGINKQSMVLSNDGKGTNLLKDFDSVSVKIKAGL
ncbi:MAG: cohesin domain-containing protein [bacterium]